MYQWFKVLVISVAILGAPHIFASESQSFYAKTGPANVAVNFSQHGGQLNLTYDGYLYECSGPLFDVKEVKVHFIFHSGNQTEILVRTMGGYCSSPWNYNAINAAQFGRFEISKDDPEFWSKIRNVIFKNGVVLELAFERDGYWDSDFGRNYGMSFRD